MARLALLCVASLLAGIQAVPYKSRQSSESFRSTGQCGAKDNVFQPGQTYEYKYFGKAETGLGVAESKTVGLAVDCHVRLSVPEPCHYRMKISKCEVFERDASPTEMEFSRHSSLEEEVKNMESRGEISRRGFQPSEKTREFNQAVTQFDIQAVISDGEVSQVMYEESDDIWVVNFKKGILDALQIRTDADSPRNTILVNGVQGLCPTKYTSHGTSESIVEEKDLDSCIQRSKKSWELSPLTPIWNMSFVSTVVSSRSICSYKLRRSSHIETMACKETHQLLPLPWNTHISAMSANITSTLRFVSQGGSAQPMDHNMNNKQITSILYEHENSTDIDREGSPDTEAIEILQDLVKQAVEGFDIGSPAVFDDFVTELRDSSDLTPLVQQVRGFHKEEKEVAKYLLVQGLTQCNAPACLRALTTLINTKEIPAEIFEPVVMALSLTKQQDPLFLAEITRMCETRPSRTCTLMVAAMVNKLVTDSDDDDEDIFDDEETKQAIEKAVRFITDLIEDGKCEPADKLDKADEEDDATKLIIALKAIGNLGSVAQQMQSKSGMRGGRIEEKIAKCLTDRNVPTNVTIAAIHAVRKFIPNPFISDRLLAVLADESQSQAVRAHACMAGTRMAVDRASVKNVLKVMENEKSEQIKAFMVSHIRSVLNSEDPHYNHTAKLIKQVLEESGKTLPKTRARLPHSIHLELSKFFEVPFLEEETNEFGAQVEGSVIFGSKSYLPKALHFNVSGEAWGEYVNVLETGVDLQGVEDLVEKVLGPNGLLAKSHILRQAREGLIKMVKVVEDMFYKFIPMDSMDKYGRKAYSMIQTQSFEQIVDRLLSALEDVDTTELQKIITHARNFDTNQLMETIKRNIPQSPQLTKVVEKLKRINFRDASEETLIQVLEAFGVPERKSRDILAQVAEYGVNINEIIRWMKRTDLSYIENSLRNIRAGDIEDQATNVIQKVKKFLAWFCEKYNLPDLTTILDTIQRTLKDPSELRRMKDNYFSQSQSRKNTKRGKSFFNIGEEDENDEKTGYDEEENDEASLGQMSWGKSVKDISRQETEEDEDEDDLDVTAFVRIFGNEIGFISLSDIMKFLDTQKLMRKFNVDRNWRDIMDGFDIRPTIAAKMEGIHHISTGLGLPLQITLNLTGLATLHVKLQPQGGNSFRRSAMEFEPSGAVQVVGGMAIDLPSITKVETLVNTTVKSEMELKVRVDIRENNFEVNIEKPDEELNILHVRHEVKLKKDDEDYEPFDDSKTNVVDKQKCLPEMVERFTGLKVCAELETSTFRGSKLLSHGPHELRVSVQESGSSGTEHYKFSGKQDKQSHSNRYELNFRAPGGQHRREVRALLTHDRQRNDMDLEFDVPEQSTPRMKLFVKNLNDRSSENYGVECGIDIETTPRQHYNTSITIIGKASGYGGSRYRDERIMDTMSSGYLNYTVKGSVMTPVAWVNVSTTTAKIGHTLMMEHNLTYFISDNIRVPILKKLSFPNAHERRGVSKFVLRHGIRAKNDQMAFDVQAFVKFMTFPLLSVAEPTFEHVTQLKVHRDYRHVGLHANTTWLNSHHELEFFNCSLTGSNLNSVIRLSEPATIRMNISRNDWYIGGKAHLNKEGGSELVLKGELTASGVVPECNGMMECTKKKLISEAKCVMDMLKFKSQTMEMRPHTQHRFRETRSMFEEGHGRPMKIRATIDGRLRQKSGNPIEWNYSKQNLGSGRVWELKSTLDIQSTHSAPKQAQAMITFGNDVERSEAMINLFVISNVTMTNIPYSLDHFAQLLVSREEGLVVSVNTSIDKSDDTLMGAGILFQVDVNDKKIHLGANIDTPVLEASGAVSVAKPERRPLEAKICTKTDSDKTEMLNHEMQAVIKIGSGKIIKSLKFRHPKVETEFKTEVDLYSDGSDSDFDAGMEFDNETDNTEEDTTESTDRFGSRNSERRTSGLRNSERSQKNSNRNYNSRIKRSHHSRNDEETVTGLDEYETTPRYGKSKSRYDDSSSETTTDSWDESSSRHGKSKSRYGGYDSETTTDSWESNSPRHGKSKSRYGGYGTETTTDSWDDNTSRHGKSKSRYSSYGSETTTDSWSDNSYRHGKSKSNYGGSSAESTTEYGNAFSGHHRKSKNPYGSYDTETTTESYDDDTTRRYGEDNDDDETTTRRSRYGSRNQYNSEYETSTSSYDNNDDDDTTTRRSWYGHEEQTGYNREHGFFSNRKNKDTEHKSGRLPRSVDNDYDDDTTTEESTYGRKATKSYSRHKAVTESPGDDNEESTYNRRFTSSRKSNKKPSSSRTTSNEEETNYNRRTSSYGKQRNSWSQGTEEETDTTYDRNTRRKGDRRESKGFLNSFFGNDEDENTFDSSNTGHRSQKMTSRGGMSGEDDTTFGSSRSSSKWTTKKFRDTFNTYSGISPRISSILRIKSQDRELFPSLNVEAKATIRQVSLDVDIREVPRALSDMITIRKVSIKGQIQDQKMVMKCVIDNRDEFGIELHVRNDREATGKIYDRGLTTNGETVHAQVTVSLPSDGLIAIKFKVDPDSTSKMGRHLSSAGRQAFDTSMRYAKDYSEKGYNEARRLWSDERHPAYKYTQSYMPRGSMEDWKDEAVKQGKSYYASSKDYASSLYTDDSALGTSLEEIVKEVNRQRKIWMEYVMELIRDTPAGEWVDSLPSFEDVTSKIKEVAERHLSPQLRIIKSRQSCILMQTCDAMGALRSVQEVAIEITQTIDASRARDLAQSAFKIVQELLVDVIRAVKEKARRNDSIRQLIGTVNLDELENRIRTAQAPSIDTILDAAKAVLLVVKDVAVERFDAVEQEGDGSIVVKIPHPFKWSSFKSMPRWTDEQRQKAYDYYDRTRRAFDEYKKTAMKDVARVKFPGRDQPMHFRWSDLKQFPKKNMPSQVAMIFGDRHIMTFDGKVYAIPEAADQQCTYLLSRGMKDKKFSLVKDRNAVTLTVPEMVISITEKNEVRINNSMVQLPVESHTKRTKVTLVGDTVEVESDVGLTLKVTGEKKLVVVELSTALWDETVGLLGSNDNEASNDWEMPSGKRASHVEEFLNSYEVGKSSQCRLVKGREDSSLSGQRCPKSSKCAQLFGSGSPLSQCFQNIDPEEFKQACETESNKCGRTEADETVCNVVAAYRKACAAQNIETESPEDCEACEGGRRENSEWTVRGNQRKVDSVILVSEHRDFASNAAPEKIRSLVDTITRKLRQTSAQDVRVALVGFSGAGVHKKAHTHTIDHEQFGTPDKLAQALRTLQFKGTEKTDALEAIEYVLDSHDFRPEATKVMLVFGAEESELISAHSRLQSVKEKLETQGVTLTIFSKYGSEDIRDRDHGVNYDGSIFSSKSMGSQQQSSSRRVPEEFASYGQMPNRKLSYLAKSSRGAVFQLDTLTGGDRTRQHQLEERAASTIAEQVKREENMCKRCVCKETDLDQLISACRPTACA